MGTLHADRFDWNQAAIDLLKKLFADGLSASRIAGELGGDLTRNAIIGKIHRLGLSGRNASETRRQGGRQGGIASGIVRGAGTSNPRLQDADIGKRIRSKARANGHAGGMNAVVLDHKKARREEDDAELEATEAVDIIPDTDIPVEQRKTLAQLGPKSCRWPCGDPEKPDFFFCGSDDADVFKGRPYCRQHTIRAAGAARGKVFVPRERTFSRFDEINHMPGRH